MERESSREYNALVNEITNGMEQVKQLREYSAGNEEVVLERMLASYEEALLILNGSASQGQCQSVVSSSPESPDSSTSVDKVTEYEDSSRGSSPPRSKIPRRREPLLKQIVRVRAESLDASGESLDDGYIWRKYGHKELLGSKYSRSYFRCTYRNKSNNQGCLATKQVQRSDEDPSIFEITYGGKHTCIPKPADPSLTLPGKRDDSAMEELKKQVEFVEKFAKEIRIAKERRMSRADAVNRLKAKAVKKDPPVGSTNRPVKFSDLEIKSIRMRDEGGNKVYEVVDRSTGAAYALKEIGAHYGVREFFLKSVKDLDHPNLVKCHEIFVIDGRVYLLLEDMDLGSLAGVDIPSESSLADVARQVLLGLSYLHHNKISHGDIKPSNIYANSMKQVKVSYLGKVLSKMPVVASGGIGGIYDQFSWDVWCLGLSILKLCKGSHWRFKEPIDSSEVFGSSNEVGAHQKSTSSVELWQFLLCCMKTDLSKRWTSDELLRHPFVLQRSVIVLKQKRELSTTPAIDVISDVTLSTVTSDLNQSYGGGDQVSPRSKKPEISVEDDTQDFGGLFGTPDYGRCVQHCALFLPDIEFEKDKLVQMWIADEIIDVNVFRRAEDLGNTYFDALVREEVIIPSGFDNLFRRLRYKVNTSKASTWFPKLSQYLKIDKDNLDCAADPIHLTFMCNKRDPTLFNALKKFKQMRTLLVREDSGAFIKELPFDIFLVLKQLRTLDLSQTHISELPMSIGKLESLHYLDTSETPIKHLPESTDRLSLLEVLRLKSCFKLSALPKGLGRLTNLRHLELHIVGQLKSMPKGMGMLTKLQTLQAFLVGRNDGYRIGELKNMNDITGSFCISGLENVSDAKEAKEGALADKKHINQLQLRWHDDGNENSAEILECLQPHFHLKELEIIFYSGTRLPSWMGSPAFTELSSITLFKCINCSKLPSIGELPSLKTLHIVEMKYVKDMKTLFCRDDGTRVLNAFPKLEKLKLENMFSLEEWTDIEHGDFQCLRHISIAYCPKLSVLSHLSRLCSLEHFELSQCMELTVVPKEVFPGSLETLIIRECPKIKQLSVEHGVQDDWLKTVSIKNLWIDFEKIAL